MHQSVNRPSHIQDVLQSFYEHQRLVALVKSMTQEIERLHDDNAQLHAAVKFYRDAVRKCTRQERRRTKSRSAQAAA